MRPIFVTRRRRSGAVALPAIAALLLACIKPTEGAPGIPNSTSAATAPEPQGQPAKAEQEAGAPSRRVVFRLVRKRDGQPIPGAMVVIASCYYDTPRGLKIESVSRDERVEWFTDRQGYCSVEAPTGASGLTILLAQDGFIPVSRRVQWRGKTIFQYETARGWVKEELRNGTVPTVTHELEPGAPIGGLVKDFQGRPITGAEVTLAFRDDPGGFVGDSLTPSNWSSDGNFPYLHVKTDAEGRWRTASAPAELGPSAVVLTRVVHPEYVSETGGFRRRLSLKTACAMTGVFPMKPGVVVSGHVRDDKGRPVSGARVVLDESMNMLLTKTDGTGQFVFAHADDDPGQRIVLVEAAGFAPVWQIVPIRPGVTDLKLSLTPCRLLRGRVMDRKGLPVAGVNVRAERDGYAGLGWHATTDANGLFAWPDAPLEGEIRFDLHKPGHAHAYPSVSAKANLAHLTYETN